MVVLQVKQDSLIVQGLIVEVLVQVMTISRDLLVRAEGIVIEHPFPHHCEGQIVESVSIEHDRDCCNQIA